MNRPTVLILASDPAFSREITANWPQDPASRSNFPEFVVLEEGFSRDLQNNQYDLAIADSPSAPACQRPGRVSCLSPTPFLGRKPFTLT